MRACCLLFAFGTSACEPAPYEVAADVSYDATIGFDGTLDVYAPTADSVRTNRPAILAIHGGVHASLGSGGIVA
jgi:acetyl esterase/lipase